MDNDSPEGRDRTPNVGGSYLKAFEVDGSVDRFLTLPVRSMKLVTASAAFTRLRSVLECTCKANWDEYDEERWDRGIDAAEDYGILRETLLTTLEGVPAFRSAYDLAHQAFPLPDSTFAAAFELVSVMDPMPDLSSANATKLLRWWTLDREPEIAALEDELEQLGAQGGVDPFAPDINAFLLAEDEIGPVLGNVFEAVRDTWQRKQARSTSAEPPSSSAVGAKVDSCARRSGRRPVDVTYEMAASTWSEMTSDYEALCEPRGPNQVDLCDALSAQGHPIGLRTLQYRIQKWRTEGLPWPPLPAD